MDSEKALSMSPSSFLICQGVGVRAATEPGSDLFQEMVLVHRKLVEASGEDVLEHEQIFLHEDIRTDLQHENEAHGLQPVLVIHEIRLDDRQTLLDWVAMRLRDEGHGSREGGRRGVHV
jgi:hypothetical protein